LGVALTSEAMLRGITCVDLTLPCQTRLSFVSVAKLTANGIWMACAQPVQLTACAGKQCRRQISPLAVLGRSTSWAVLKATRSGTGPSTRTSTGALCSNSAAPAMCRSGLGTRFTSRRAAHWVSVVRFWCPVAYSSLRLVTKSHSASTQVAMYSAACGRIAFASALVRTALERANLSKDASCGWCGCPFSCTRPTRCKWSSS
jgi:hypothetical protein